MSGRDRTRKKRTKSRANGEGSIYPLPNGKWQVAVTIPQSGGRRLRRTRDTLEEARAAKRELEKEVQKLTGGTSPKARKLTVGTFLAAWLETTASASLRATTLASYEQITRLYILPSLGHIPLQALTPQKVQLMINDLWQRGLSKRTIEYTRAVLRRALSYALRWGLIERNPAQLVDLPKGVRSTSGEDATGLSTAKPERAHRIWTLEEVSRFLEVIKGHRLEPLFITGLALGLRKGELLGLRWGDVDFETGRISINTSLQRVPRVGVKRFDTKNGSSLRTTKMPQIVVDALKAHRVGAMEAKLKAGRRWRGADEPLHKDAPLFASTVGTPIEGRNLNRVLTPLLARAGLQHLEVRELRTEAASLLLHSGVSMEEVSKLLGHASYQTTQRFYQRLLDRSGQGAADTMDSLLGGFREGQL